MKNYENEKNLFSKLLSAISFLAVFFVLCIGSAHFASLTPVLALSKSTAVANQTTVTANYHKGLNKAFASDSQTDTPPTATIELHSQNSNNNEKISFTNILPGDSFTKIFAVKVYHDTDIDLFFNAVIIEEVNNLGDALHIKITHLEAGKILCDAPFSQIHNNEFAQTLKTTVVGETVASYKIDVSMDTSVGNEYQASALRADFNWQVKDTSKLAPPPKTVDPTAVIIFSASMVALSLVTTLIVIKRKKVDKRLIKSGLLGEDD